MLFLLVRYTPYFILLTKSFALKLIARYNVLRSGTPEILLKGGKTMEETFARKLVRGLLIWFLWFIGSLIINHSSLKPEGWKSRTAGLIGWGILTLGIYNVVVALCNLVFEPKSSKNIGYFKV